MSELEEAILQGGVATLLHQHKEILLTSILIFIQTVPIILFHLTRVALLLLKSSHICV